MSKVVKGSKQRSVKIVEHRPLFRLTVYLIIIAIFTCAIFGSYYYGQLAAKRDQDKSKTEIVTLSEALALTKKELRAAEQALANIELGAEVDRTASETVRKEIADLRAEIALLQEDNGFYRSLMSPSGDAKGLQIGTVEVTSTGVSRRFSYRVVVQQLVVRHELLTGQLLFRVVGKENGAPKQYALHELSDQVSSEKIKLRFKYFQGIEGEMILPEFFEPDHIELVAESSGKKSSKKKAQRVEKKFGWLVEET